MTDLSELEKLARAARDCWNDDQWVHSGSLDDVRHLDQEDCDFIAAANPATILALIADRDALRAGLEPFALAADNMDGDEPDALFIYDSPESTLISYADLRRARQLLTPRSETPDNLMEGEK